MSDLEMTANASSMINEIEKVIKAQIQLRDSEVAAAEAAIKLNAETGKLQATYRITNDALGQVSINLEQVGNKMQIVGQKAIGTAEQLKTASLNLAKSTESIAKKQAKEGRFDEARLIALDIDDPKRREKLLASIKETESQISKSADNIRRSLTRGFENLTDIPARTNLAFKSAARDLAAFGALQGKTIEQIQESIKKVQTGQVVAFDPKTQAKQAEFQELAIRYSERLQSILEKQAKSERNVAQEVQKTTDAYGRQLKVTDTLHAQAIRANEARTTGIQKAERIRVAQDAAADFQKKLASGQLLKLTAEPFMQTQVASDRVVKTWHVMDQTGQQLAVTVSQLKGKITEFTTTTIKGSVEAKKAIEEQQRAAVVAMQTELASQAKKAEAARVAGTTAQRQLQIERQNAILRGQETKRQADVQIQAQQRAQQALAGIKGGITSGTFTQLGPTLTNTSAAANRMTESFRIMDKAGQQFAVTATYAGGKLVDVNQRMLNSVEAAHQSVTTWRNIGTIVNGILTSQAIYGMINQMQASVEGAKDLQIQIAQIQTISESGFNVEQWQKGILAISNATGLVAKDVASGVYDTLSNQIADGAKSLEFMATAGKLAVTTNSTLQDSVNALSSALNSYGLTSDQATKVGDIFFRMIDLGRVKMPEFANSIGRVLPGANELGVSLEEVAAFMSVATRQGVTFANAQTYLFNIFSRMLKPAGELRNFFASIGVESGKAAIEAYGFVGVLQKIAEFTQGRPELAAQLFPDIRGMRGVIAVTGEKLGEYANDLNQFQNAFGSVAEANLNMVVNQGKKFQIEMEKIKNYFINDWGTNIIKTFNYINENVVNATDAVKVLGNALLILAGPAIVGGLVNTAAGLTKVGGALSFVKILGGIPAGIAVAMAAVTAVANKVADDFNVAREAEEKFYADAIANSKELIERGLKPLDESINSTFQYFKQVGSAINVGWKNLVDSAEEASKENKSNMETLLSGFLDFVKEGSKGIKEEMSTIKKEIADISDYINKAPEAAMARLRKIRLEEADSPVEKQKLLLQEYQRLDSLVGAAPTLELRKQIEKEMLDIIEEMRKIQKDTDKDRTEATKKLFENEKKIAKLKQEGKEAEKRDKAERDKDYNAAFARQKQKDPKERSRTAIAQRSTIDNREFRQANDAAERRAAISNLEKENAEIKAKLERDTASIRFNYQEEELRLVRKRIEQEEEWLGIQKEEQEKQKRLLQERQQKEREVIKQVKELTKFNVTDLFRPGTKPETRVAKLGEQEVKIEEMRKKIEELATDEFALKKELTDSLIQYEKDLRAKMDREEQKEKVNQFNKDLDDLRKKFDESRKVLAEKEVGIATKIIGPGISFKQEAEKILTGYAGQYLFSGTPLIDMRARPAQQQYNEVKALLASISQTTAPKDMSGIVDKFYIEFGKLVTALNAYVVKTGRPGPELTQSLGGLAGLEETIDKETNGLKSAEDEMNKTRDKLQNLVANLEMATGVEKTQIVASINNTMAIDDLTKVNKELGEATTILSGRMMDLMRDLKQRGGEVPTKIELKPPEIGTVVDKAMGGYIHGSDTIPAMLSKGEFVVNAGSTRRFYSQLVAMNSVKGYAQGGLVTNIGDINLSMQATGNTQADIVAIGKGLRREIRRGRIKLN